MTATPRKAPRIGTAGWSIPAAHRRRFPGEGPVLERYARVMTCVEINSSFYRPHQRATYEKWAAQTPADFRFSVKTPRELTQFRRLRDPDDVLDRFHGEVTGLGRKLGVLLVQLPPSLGFDEETADAFFAAIKARFKAPVALEPRHRSWFTPEIDSWLKRRRIARVAADPAPVPGAGEPGGWRGLTYMRLHGSPRIYWSAYDKRFLRDLATRLQPAPSPSWCIFDNTVQGHALGDALAVVGRR